MSKSGVYSSVMSFHAVISQPYLLKPRFVAGRLGNSQPIEQIS